MPSPVKNHKRMALILILTNAFMPCAWADDLDLPTGHSLGTFPTLIEAARQCLQSSIRITQNTTKIPEADCSEAIHQACINENGNGTVQERECWLGEFEVWSKIRTDFLQQLAAQAPFWNDEALSAEIRSHLIESDRLWEQSAIESCRFAAERFEESPLATDMGLSCRAKYEADRAIQYNIWLHG